MSCDRMLKRSPLAYLASNILSLIGVALVTTAGILWLLTLPAFYRGEASTPYIGILLFLILPGVFVTGLVLIPLGIGLHIWKRRKAAKPVRCCPEAVNSAGWGSSWPSPLWPTW